MYKLQVYLLISLVIGVVSGINSLESDQFSSNENVYANSNY